MDPKKPGLCIVVTGMSGVGKSTVVDAMLQRLGNRAACMVMSTTRAKRPGEVNGVDYHFMTRVAFLDAKATGQFIESEETDGHMYGSSGKVLATMRAQHDVVLAITSPNGARSYLEKVPDCITVFLTASSDQLLRRLRGREGMKPAELERRIAAIPDERAMASDFDHVIENSDGRLNDTLTRIFRIMRRA